MNKLTRKHKKVLNNIYFQSDLKKIFRYPLNAMDFKYIESDNDTIEELLKHGYLKIVKKFFVPSVYLDVIRVSDKGMKYIKKVTIDIKDEKLKEKEQQFKDQQRKQDKDFYVHERNPFMGWNLRNRGEKRICTKCFTINKPCGHDDEYIKELPPTARPPRKNASKKRWNDFIALFRLDK